MTRPRLGAFDDESVDAEDAQHAFAGESLFGLGFVGLDFLPIEPFQDLVGLQGDLQQADQGFDASWRFQEDGADRQGRLHLVMEQLDVVLLLVLAEERVGMAPGRRGRGHEHGQAVVLFLGLGGSGVESEFQTVCGGDGL